MLSPDPPKDHTGCAFLALVLPQKGPYVAFIVEKASKRKYVKFASTIQELWELIKAADSADHTAYHACAGYKEARYDPRGTPPAQRQYGRTKNNARCSKAFWVDLDAGPEKPYPDWKAAAYALAEFCKATGLPRPVVVRSGFGLHAYWPLLHSLDPERWIRYARGLKALCVKHDLKADPTRTADITSVLRTPGTHHRKSGNRLVQCNELVGPYDLMQFEILLSVSSDASDPTSDGPRSIEDELGRPIPPYLQNRPYEGVNETLSRSFSKTFERSFAELIAEHCEQVRALRDNKGKISEPKWYACLGVLAFAEDGEQVAHAWSSGDERYTIEETRERLDRARQLSGATTCTRFHQLDSEVCECCPWWGKIKSPIVLGRQQGQPHCESTDRIRAEVRDEERTQDQKNRRDHHNQNHQQEQTSQTEQEQQGSSDPGSGPAQSAFPLRWHGEENPNIVRNWLVKPLLPETGAGLISGQWGTAKTFIAIDLSVCVMTGHSFAGCPVKRKGGVLFIAAEGASETPIRLHGLLETKSPITRASFRSPGPRAA